MSVVFQGNVHVRHLDWEESIMAGRLQQAAQSGDTTNTSTSTGSLQNQPGMPSQEQASSAPCVALEEKFEVVIGTDILYEVGPSRSVVVLSQRSSRTHLHYIPFPFDPSYNSSFNKYRKSMWVSLKTGAFAGSSLKTCGCCVETSSDYEWPSYYLLCSQGPG